MKKYLLLLSLLITSLSATTIFLGGQNLKVEIADTPALQQRGLAERETLEEGKGMLFVYKEPQILVFWMKDTKIPLSIAFFDKDQNLIHIADMIPLRTDLSYQSRSPALYALEVPQGWFEKHQIKIGTKFSFRDR